MPPKTSNLQRKRNLRANPDPIPTPSIESSFTSDAGGPASLSALETGSETSFPSLVSTPVPKSPTVPSTWATSRPTTQKNTAKLAPQLTHTFDLSNIDLKTAGKDGKPITLSEAIKTVMAETNSHIEASSQRNTGITTFFIKAGNDLIVKRAQRQLTAILSTAVTQTVDTPLSSVSSVIGAKGATLKGLQKKYFVKIQVPPRDSHLSANGNARAASDDEAEEPTIPITVTGPSPSVRDAIAELNSIISVKKLKVTRRAKDVPAQALPFISTQTIDGSAFPYGAFSEANIEINASRNHSVEFMVNRDFVGRLVGSGGAAVKKLKDEFNVRIEFIDKAYHGGWSNKTKKRKATGQTKVKITGRKENVEDAQNRLDVQIDKLEGETQKVLQIPNSYHSGLIGSGRTDVTRLEEMYGVTITFPRGSNLNGDGAGRTQEQLKSNEVSIKGGKRGIISATAKLLEMVESDKANNQIVSFAIPTHAIARIISKSGAHIKGIPGAQIDIEKDETSAGITNISVHGNPEECKNAKEAILAVVEEVEDADPGILIQEHN